jgi:signal transduction histidine kinase
LVSPYQDSYLDQLVMNLLENAIEHNESESRAVYLQVSRQERGYVLAVADNGPGMEKPRRDEIFDPSRRFGGVGLHVVSQIVEKYGGHIDVYNRIEESPSHGLEVRVWLPSTQRAETLNDTISQERFKTV